MSELKLIAPTHEEMESEFRSLAENLPDNIARWDVDGCYLYINPVHKRTLGVSANDMLGKAIPDSHTFVKAAIAQVVATGQAATLVRQSVVVNGETQIHDVSLVPERDSDGKVASVLGIGRDMTEVYRLQDDIAVREQQLRSLADSLPGMMGSFHSRADGSVCMPYVSPNIEKLFGLRPQDVANDASPLMALNHPDDAQRVAESIAESARTMTVWHEEYRILHPLLGERWMESNTKPELHPDGGIIWHGYVHDITERKHVEEQLRLKEFALNQANDAVYLIGDTGRFAYVNQAACRALGYSRDELLEFTTADIDPDYSPEMGRTIREKTRTEGPFMFETRHRRRDGSVFPVEIQTSMFEYHGQWFSMTLARNITERKRTEQLLKQREQAYRNLVENIPDLIVRYDPELSRIYVNPAWEAASGLSAGEVVDVPSVNILRVPNGAANLAYAEKVRKVFETGTLQKTEFTWVNARGVTLYLDYFMVPEYDPSGKVVSVLSVGHDITERKRLEAELTDSRKFLNQVVDSIPDPIFVKDREHRWVLMNEALCTVLGKPRDILLGKSDYDFFPKAQADVFWEKDELVFTSRETNVNEESITWGDGTLRYIQTKKTPFISGDGQVLLVGVIRDITEHKLNEERLRKSHDILRALSAHQETEHEKERKELAYQIHEDLAQNLAALRMNLSLLEVNDDPAGRAPVLKTLHEITDQSIARIRDIVSMLRPTVLDLGLAPALHWLTDDFKGVGLRFDLALQEDIPLSDETSTFLFRAAEEALLNVALHAAATQVYLSLDVAAGVCRLLVRDNGCGLNPVTPHREGGFGLMRLTEQARNLGGDLSIESMPKQGTALQIQVPVSSGKIPTQLER